MHNCISFTRYSDFRINTLNIRHFKYSYVELFRCVHCAVYFLCSEAVVIFSFMFFVCNFVVAYVTKKKVKAGEEGMMPGHTLACKRVT